MLILATKIPALIAVKKSTALNAENINPMIKNAQIAMSIMIARFVILAPFFKKRSIPQSCHNA
jgi:hypothetical protein